jgi:hypothetical protein
MDRHDSTPTATRTRSDGVTCNAENGDQTEVRDRRASRDDLPRIERHEAPGRRLFLMLRRSREGYTASRVGCQIDGRPGCRRLSRRRTSEHRRGENQEAHRLHVALLSTP